MKQLYPVLLRYIFLILLNTGFTASSAFAQAPITSIGTSNHTLPQVSYSGIKGAGLRNPLLGTLISSWDSTGTSFNINFNAPAAANVRRLDQFNVSGISTPIITMPVSGAMVKLRRKANADVGDDRNYFNFWAAYSNIPAPGAASGTFDFTAPEVVNPEQAFATNNLNSGYDNIFQNSIANPHFGNIERVDYIIPSGLTPRSDTDRIQSGVVIIDRGVGDPFKIAPILAIGPDSVPTLFGSLISVNALQFGGNLLGSNIDYAIMINDVSYKSESRPSTRSSQNLRGVYISLADLGIATNQVFYGYALFGSDVTTANADWNTYPNNSSSLSQLDPVNVMGMFKSVYSLLPLQLDFEAKKERKTSLLQLSFHHELVADEIIVERSVDGKNFLPIGYLRIQEEGVYHFTDPSPVSGDNFYRLKIIQPKAAPVYSETKRVYFEETIEVQLYPNPAIDVLNIRIPQKMALKKPVAIVINNAGQKILTTQFSPQQTLLQLSISHLPKGYYKLLLHAATGSTEQPLTISFVK